MAKKLIIIYTSLFFLFIMQPIIAQSTFAAFTEYTSTLGIIFAFILLFIGIVFIAIETILYSYGALALCGLIILGIGLFMLADNNALTQTHALAILIVIIAVTVILVLFISYFAWKSYSRKVVSGQEALIGQQGAAINNFKNNQGWVRINGEVWQAFADKPIAQGQAIRIVKIDGLTLYIEPINK